MLHSDVGNMHATLQMICSHLELEKPRPLAIAPNHRTGGPDDEHEADGDVVQDEGEGEGEGDKDCEVSPPDSPSAVQAPIDTFLDIAKLSSPNSASSPVSLRVRRPRSVKHDLVSKGVVCATVAERLIDRYFSRLDHYLYGIAGERQELSQMQATSPVLLAAICTVSALHEPDGQKLYEACNNEFRLLVTRSTFEKRDVDYVRALCISSFWLADASRILSSDAIRRAADMRLHRSFDTALQGASQGASGGGGVPRGVQTVAADQGESAAAADRVRLWYLLFVCDQHLSILHNRDSLLRSDKDIAIGWESFLHRAETTESDVRILSQVSLLLIMAQARDVLGSDNESQLPPSMSNQIQGYSRQLDRWFSKFSALFVTNAYIGDFPQRGLQLHYQFGKLYLGNQVFKKLHGQLIHPQLLSAATMAHDAAVAIFEMILAEKELQESLVGMPHYFHIMIAFAGHLLLEISKNYHKQLSINTSDDFRVIDAVLTLFRNTRCIRPHPIWRMAAGLSQKLLDCAAAPGMPQIPTPAVTSIQGVHHHDAAAEVAPSAFAMQAQPTQQQMPADFLLTDFGDFTFPELASSFMMDNTL